jgi:NitT/TauT family transport system substrate-binding protein
VFAIANPEAAIRILWEVYPQTKPTGKGQATALRGDLITLEARASSWRYEPVGGKRWGDNVEENYQAYPDWLLAQGIVTPPASPAPPGWRSPSRRCRPCACWAA